VAVLVILPLELEAQAVAVVLEHRAAQVLLVKAITAEQALLLVAEVVVEQVRLVQQPQAILAERVAQV
jgi:hypothetical protein